MLVLSRKILESIRISDDITITILRIRGNKVRIGIEAPKEIPVLRAELQDQSLEAPLKTANRKPMPHVIAALQGLESLCH